MLQNIFRNMGDVTKNLLIINVVLFLATELLEKNGISLHQYLSLFSPGSVFFRPYQFVTHIFMHGGFRHLLFNMLGLVFLGSHLERVWGAKKFFMFYFVTGIGAAFFSALIFELMAYQSTGVMFSPNHITVGFGASGAIFGLVAAYGLLFPNTEFHLYFLIPVKAKWFAIAAAVWSLYSGINPVPDPVTGTVTGHFDHLGGMIFAFVLIQIWKRSNKQFY